MNYNKGKSGQMPYKDKEKRYEAIRKSVAKNPDHYRMLNRNNQKKPKRIGYQLLRRYGIDFETYNVMLARQNGRCAICNNLPKNGSIKRLHVDHDHITGKVRGILCASCNRSIAALDNKEWLVKAKDYLENNS